MYIKDFEINHIADGGYGYHPRIELSIEDYIVDEINKIRDLASRGDGIQIISNETLQNLINLYNSRYDIKYCLNAMFGRGSNSTDDLKVTKVIYHNPATIVFWSDGTKTVVKCGKGDTYDKEKGFYIACAKKLFGNDYKAVGRMNKALEMAEDKNGR